MQNVGGGQASVVEPMRWQFRLPEWCLVASLVSLSPLVAVHAMHLWERPHFQFFPLAWIAFGLLVYQRARLAWYENSWRGRLGLATWGVGLLLAVGAAYLFSPWLGMLSTILCLAGWGFLRLGNVPAPRWFAWLALLVVTLPLPGSMDAQFINRLQSLSSQSAGALLDLFGILHLRQGNLIEVQSKELFVDEACSGIDSFYALAAIALLMMIWQKRPFVVSVLTLLTVPVWAWFGNVLRLLVIVWMLDQFELDLSHGWLHTVLGLLMFIVASGGLFATLDSATQVFKRFSSSTMPRDRKFWHLAYNNLVCYPAKAPKVKDEEAEYFVGESANSAPQSVAKQKLDGVEDAKRFSSGRYALPVYVITCIAIAMMTIGHFFKADAITLGIPFVAKDRVEKVCEEASLPQTLLSAERLDFRKHDRTPGSFFGEYSRTWGYSERNNQLVFSLDFPFRGSHPLWLCYLGAGHVIDQPPVYFEYGGIERGACRVKFRNDIGASSYLWFTLCDANGSSFDIGPYEEPSNGFGLGGIADAFRGNLSKFIDQPVTYQFQLYIQPGQDLTSDELDKYYKIFLEALPYAVKQVQQLNAK